MSRGFSPRSASKLSPSRALAPGVLGGLEVQGEALLAAVRPDKVRRLAPDARVVGAGKVADAGTLDFDDARALVGEVAGAQGGCEGLFEAHDCDAGQGEVGGGGRMMARGRESLQVSCCP
ncbi:hypothetical protein BN1708_004141 [Verticillium longisporum]|uniref:Uncharacterized protein n=1 Tax=Verticillium longisporum TaxID=100787 RepID=A0A0G4LVN1_VERLO|nr:hypothetical protein BN1708_004141 [Verticillium longisporum]